MKQELNTDPSLGDPFSIAPGMLVLNVSRIRDFEECPRRFLLRHVLHLAGDDENIDDASASAGRQVHEELRARHQSPARHDDTVSVDDEGTGDPWVVARARAHAVLCPRAHADYVGGEVDVRWLIARKNLLVTGRVDAIWRHLDGTLEVRDYKTGTCPDSLEDDVGAALYLLLAAAALPHRGRVRVTYESLAGEQPRTASLDATAAHLRRAYELVIGAAERIRVEKAFVARPSATTCVRCSFSGMCPHATTTAGVEHERRQT